MDSRILRYPACQKAELAGLSRKKIVVICTGGISQTSPESIKKPHHIISSEKGEKREERERKNRRINNTPLRYSLFMPPGAMYPPKKPTILFP